MCTASIFICIMTMILNFVILFILSMFIFKFFFANITDFAFSYDFCCSFVNNFIYFLFKVSYLLRMLPSGFTKLFHVFFLKDDIVDIETPDGIFSPTFLLDEFSRLFLHPSIFCIKDSISA